MLTMQEHIEREWLNARFHLLEIAAILDRIEQSGGAAAASDPAWGRIANMLNTIQHPDRPAERAGQILMELGDRPA